MNDDTTAVELDERIDRRIEAYFALPERSTKAHPGLKQILKAFKRLIKSHNSLGLRMKKLEGDLVAVIAEVEAVKVINSALIRYFQRRDDSHPDFVEALLAYRQEILEETEKSIQQIKESGGSNIIHLPKDDPPPKRPA